MSSWYPSTIEQMLTIRTTCLFYSQVKVKGGRYSVNIADGQYTCVAIYRGLMTFYDPLCHVVNGNTVEKDIVMSPFVVPGQVRAVLTWGNLIKDLDCFMLTP